MQQILITGAGKIGALIACLLQNTKDYQVHLADVKFDGEKIKQLLQKNPEICVAKLDVTDEAILAVYIRENKIKAIISSLPYFLNTQMASIAKSLKLHYFDLTEDTTVTNQVKQLAKGAKTAFVPQCGLAPGFISIVANSLMQSFEQLDFAKLRVGALPQNANNALNYALTWSTEGVINEYGNRCHGIDNSEFTHLQPLEGLENIQLDGLNYEAFNTSGGLGSLAELYSGKITTLNYKTIRYPGHCHKMRVLMNDLKLNQDREVLKNILEKAVPRTTQDVVLVYVSIAGYKHKQYFEKNYMKKVYPQIIATMPWTAIQVTTASSLCAVFDMVMSQPAKYQGLILQETFSLDDFLANRFATVYRNSESISI